MKAFSTPHGRRRTLRLVGSLIALSAIGAVAVPGAFSAAFPGGKGTLAFSSNRLVGDEPPLDSTDPLSPKVTDFEIYVVGPNDEAVQLTDNTVFFATEGDVTTPTAINDMSPAVSPDGKRIAFTRNYDPNDGSSDPDIYVMNVDGSNVVQLTKNKPGAGTLSAAEYEPAWSPDGTKIAFRREDGVNANLWMIDVATGKETQLTGLLSGSQGPNAYDGDPAWSPEGKRIAFGNGKGPTADIYMLDVATRAVTPLVTEPDISDATPSWSPDGTMIAFRRGDEGGGAGIWKVPVSGGTAVRLTDPLNGAPAPEEGEAEPVAYSDLMPAWSPDGSLIAFHSTRPSDPAEAAEGDPDIYVIHADGSDGLIGGTRLAASALTVIPPAAPLVAVAAPPVEPGGEVPLAESDVAPDWQTVATSDLRVSVVDEPDPTVLGQVTRYTVSVVNPGPSFATGVVVRVTPPAGATVVSTEVSQGTCAGLAPIGCAIGNLAVGESATVTVTVRAGALGAMSVQAAVESLTPDPDVSNNTALATTQAVCVSPKLALRIQNAVRVRIRRATPVTLTVRNTGTVPTNAVLKYTQPSGFVIARSSRGYTRSGRTLTFRWTTIQPGQQVSVRLQVRSRARTRLQTHLGSVGAFCMARPVRAHTHMIANLR